jgi:DMSO/TMAO reductase YedYZ molybdopterin-dependent catalytic subunit
LALVAPTGAQAACALLAGASFAPALTLTQAWRRRLAVEHPAKAAGGVSRRGVLRGLLASGATVAGALALGSFDVWSDALARLLGRGETMHALFPFTPPEARAAGFPVAGVEPEVTPIPHFYLLSKNDVDPRIEPAAWRLALRGAVRRPLLLTYADLVARPRTDVYVTLRCVNNPPGGRLMSTALWSGVPLASLLADVRAQAGVRAVMLHAADGYDEVIPLAAALAPGALVAYGMNGQALPRRHGGPVRALVPGFYGLKNVKWLTGVTVLAQEVPDYWARRGWTARQVHSVARIDTWQHAPGGVLVAGVAFTGTRGVTAVEVRAEAGPWRRAELDQPALSPLCWVQWRATVPLASGAHAIRARVLDGAGQPQEESVSGEYPDGATGLDSVQVQL